VCLTTTHVMYEKQYLTTTFECGLLDTGLVMGTMVALSPRCEVGGSACDGGAAARINARISASDILSPLLFWRQHSRSRIFLRHEELTPGP